MQEKKQCPYCDGEILAVARKCKHCKKIINDVPDPKSHPSSSGVSPETQKYKQCPYCGEEILAVARKCKHCKKTIDDLADIRANPSAGSFINLIRRTRRVRISYSPWKPLGLFILMNTAICLSVMVLTLGNVRLSLLALLLGMAGPFITLFASKFIAKLTCDVEVIDPQNFAGEKEERLYRLTEALAEKAGLPQVPEVGIYKSPDVNAFATGYSRSNALVAFSSALSEKMDEESVAAIAAHEIAHIANGDMLSMTVMQSVINTIVILINIGLHFALDDFGDGLLGRLIKTLVRWIIVVFFMFLGNLLLLWFSRYREFGADQLAAELVHPDSVVKALNDLRSDENQELPEDLAQEQQPYATFKISSAPAAMDIFSTHPALERRIERIKSIFKLTPAS